MAKAFLAQLYLDKEEVANLLSKVDLESIKPSSEFFYRFGLNKLISDQKYHEAIILGHRVLGLVKDLDPGKFKDMHKGALYYSMGIAAYLLNDYQTAIFFMDATASEDVKNDKNPDTPGRLFLRLIGNNPDQAAKQLTEDAERKVQEFINEYNKIVELHKLNFPHINIDTIRHKFLEPAIVSTDAGFRSLASTFISFFIEFDYSFAHLNARPELGTNEPFFIHLFKGCLLFESILKKAPGIKSKRTTLGGVLRSLDAKNKMGLPSNINISARSLSAVLADTLNISDHPADAVLITGRLRNTLGHDLGWPDQLNLPQYGNGFYLISISCLHAISTLY